MPRRNEEYADLSSGDWQELLGATQPTAVQRRMVSDVPVGVLVSGGIDSSANVALLADEGQQGLQTFSIGFETVGDKEGDAVGLAPGGRPRATVLGLDVLTDSDGRWVVLEDNLQVPSGIGYALANRRSAVVAFSELHEAVLNLRSPEGIGSALHSALCDAAPRRCARAQPQVVVLSDGPANSAWYEHRLLAEEMGVPVNSPDDLVPHGDGVAARTQNGLLAIDVVYRRLGAEELLGDTPTGTLLRNASRACTGSIANVPGNGVADDKAMYAFVHPMIRYYLNEMPILNDVGYLGARRPRSIRRGPGPDGRIGRQTG